MLLIVGGTHDTDAHSAVARLELKLGPRQAALLDAVDLSRPGWRLFANDPGDGAIVASGRVISVREVTAVLVRRMAVYSQELGHVHEDDRAYVASEMTALLAWWLRVVPVPVLNRPAGGAMLCGPGWRPERWRALASRLGFPVVRLRREISKPALLPVAVTEVVSVGDVIVGEAPRPMADCLLALARAAKVALLYAAFDRRGALVTAHTLPPLSEDLLEAVAQYAGLEGEKDRVDIERLPGVSERALPVGGYI
jgi:hypothetical protein